MVQKKKSEEKFIPEQYKTSCVEDRLELLKGLIDTDGHNLSSMYEYSTSSIKLARDVKELVESHNGKVFVKSTDAATEFKIVIPIDKNASIDES